MAMRIPLFIPILCLFVFSESTLARASANDEGCSTLPAMIDVQIQYDDVVYDTTTPMLRIRDLSLVEKKDGAKHSKQTEAWPVGLATGEMFFNLNSSMIKKRSDTSAIICGQIKSLTAVLGFKNNKIYVAREFPKRSCPYREVLKHEEKHKTVDRELLQEYAEKIKQALADVCKKIGTVKSSSSAIVDDEINSALNQAVQKLTRELDEDHTERQKQVDSKEEYQRITDSCDGQTMDVVRQRLDLLETSRPGSTRATQAPSPSEP